MPTSRKLEVIAAPDKPIIVTAPHVRRPRAPRVRRLDEAGYIKRWIGRATWRWCVCDVDLRVGAQLLRPPHARRAGSSDSTARTARSSRPTAWSAPTCPSCSRRRVAGDAGAGRARRTDDRDHHHRPQDVQTATATPPTAPWKSA